MERIPNWAVLCVISTGWVGPVCFFHSDLLRLVVCKVQRESNPITTNSKKSVLRELLFTGIQIRMYLIEGEKLYLPLKKKV